MIASTEFLTSSVVEYSVISRAIYIASCRGKDIAFVVFFLEILKIRKNICNYFLYGFYGDIILLWGSERNAKLCWAVSSVTVRWVSSAYAISFVREASRSRTFEEMFFAMRFITSKGISTPGLYFLGRIAHLVS
jgi:hypothetical protein